MSAIEFLCPNGHKIRCQAEQVGRPAKCPRCGVRFRVPDATAMEASEAPESDTFSQPDFDDFSILQEKPQTPPPPPQNIHPKKDSQIEFLCPNGHRLYGSMSLAGRPGQCPDCGARFRIPSYDEISLKEEAEPDNRWNKSDGQSVPSIGPASPQELQQMQTVQNRSQAAWEDEVMPIISSSAPANKNPVADKAPDAVKAHDVQPIAQLFVKLWAVRPKGATVELHLRNSETVIVEQYMATLSQQNFGVFGAKSLDGSFTLMAIAWDTIDRVLVRGLHELPK